MCVFIILAQYLLMASRSLIWPCRKDTWASNSSSWQHRGNNFVWVREREREWEIWARKETCRERWRKREILTASFLPMVLLWERVMLKKESFLVAERGGDKVLMSLPLETGRGGDAVVWPCPPERLSMLGEELTVLEVWPEKERNDEHKDKQMRAVSSRERTDEPVLLSQTLILFLPPQCSNLLNIWVCDDCIQVQPTYCSEGECFESEPVSLD